MILEEILLNTINFSDTEFLLSYSFQYDQIKESIKMVGLINPPILLKCKNKFKIISGFKRIFALKKLNQKKINAFVITDDYPPIRLLQMSILDNCLIRPFNPIEKSLIINKLKKYINKDTIIKEYFRYIGLEPSSKLYILYEPLINLEGEIKKSIAIGELSEKSGFQILNFTKEDRLSLFHLLTQLKPSFSKQNEIIELIFEISKRENISIKDVIQSDEINTLLINSKLTTPQRLEKIREYLKKKRFPQLSKLEEEFETFKKKIGISPDIKFAHPTYFEGNTYELHLSFSKIAQLKKQINILNKIANSEDLKKIIKNL